MKLVKSNCRLNKTLEEMSRDAITFASKRKHRAELVRAMPSVSKMLE